MNDKRVRITLELSNSMLRMLKAAITLKKLNDPMKKLTAVQVIGLLAFMEGCGSHEEQILAQTPSEWFDDIKIIHGERRVFEDGKQIAGPPVYAEATSASVTVRD